MKPLVLLTFISACLLIFACNKDDRSERFKLLTAPIWTTDSLLANGVDATGPGQILEKFAGDAKFDEDGTGYFGEYTGQWRFNTEETQLTIITDSLPLPIITDIIELTGISLKITTTVSYSNQSFDLRMTFKAK